MMGVDFGLINAKKTRPNIGGLLWNSIVSNRAISEFMRSRNKHHSRAITSRYYMRKQGGR